MTEIDEVVKEDWIEDTDSFDRVKTVLRQTTQHKSANEISKIAEVSEKTAKKNLDKLAGLNVAEKTSTGNGSLYRRSKDWYLNKEIDRLREEATIEEIKRGIERMNDDISEYRDKYGV